MKENKGLKLRDKVENKVEKILKKDNKENIVSIDQKPAATVEPLIYVDIHINSEKIERLAIFKGDHYEEVINRFCLKHGKLIKLTKTGLSIKEMDALKESLRKHIPSAYVDLMD